MLIEKKSIIFYGLISNYFMLLSNYKMEYYNYTLNIKLLNHNFIPGAPGGPG